MASSHFYVWGKAVCCSVCVCVGGGGGGFVAEQGWTLLMLLTAHVAHRWFTAVLL
jgi:hypothetical protein